MGSPKSGYNLNFVFTPSGSGASAIAFDGKAKTIPGLELGDDVDVTTDSTTGTKNKEPGDLPSTTDGEIVIPADFAVITAISAVLGNKGKLVVTDKAQGKTLTWDSAATSPIQKAWIKSIKPSNAALFGSQPEAAVSFAVVGLPTLGTVGG